MPTIFKATIEHVNHTTSRATVRTHTMLVDRGTAKGASTSDRRVVSISLSLWAAVSPATSSLRFARAKMR